MFPIDDPKSPRYNQKFTTHLTYAINLYKSSIANTKGKTKKEKEKLQKEEKKLLKKFKKYLKHDISSENKSKALSSACITGWVGLAELMLKNKVSVEKMDSNMRPLTAACTNGSLKIVKMLLEANALVNSESDYGNTPLVRAIEQGHAMIFGLLLQKGADVNVVTARGCTGLEFAASSPKWEIRELAWEYRLNNLVINSNHPQTSQNQLALQEFCSNYPQSTSVAALNPSNLNNNSNNDDDYALLNIPFDSKPYTQSPPPTLFTPPLLTPHPNSFANSNSTSNQSRPVSQAIPIPQEEINRQNQFYGTLTPTLFSAPANSFANGNGTNHQNRLPSGPTPLPKEEETNPLEKQLKGKYDGKIHDEYLCPLFLVLMDDPITVSSGHTFNRSSLVAYFKSLGDPEEAPCPIVRTHMIRKDELCKEKNKTNFTLKGLIEKFVAKKVKKYDEAHPEEAQNQNKCVSNFP